MYIHSIRDSEPDERIRNTIQNHFMLIMLLIINGKEHKQIPTIIPLLHRSTFLAVVSESFILCTPNNLFNTFSNKNPKIIRTIRNTKNFTVSPLCSYYVIKFPIVLSYYFATCKNGTASSSNLYTNIFL